MVFLVDWDEENRAAGFISTFTITIIFEGLLSRILLLSLMVLGSALSQCPMNRIYDILHEYYD